MKSQSLKLFAVAFVLGLITIFASAVSANAQTILSFETSFDFNVGKEKFSAGKYEIKRLEYGRYLLKNTEMKVSMIIITQAQNRKTNEPDSEYLIFNRYGENIFLRRIADRRNASETNEIFESSYEAKIRKNSKESDEKLARKDKKAEQISINLNR